MEVVVVVFYIILYIENFVNLKKVDLVEGEELFERIGDICGGVELLL